MDRHRADAQSAYVLHRRPFRDSSQIIDVLSRDHGRLALVARGVRSRRSRYRATLQPFSALELSWSIRGDLGTLTAAESVGGARQLSGDALMAAFYLNELLLKLTHRHDPQPHIFDIYAGTLEALGNGQGLDVTLRLFEFRLLNLLGYGVQLQHDIVSGTGLEAERYYRVRPTEGPLPVSADVSGPLVYTGAELAAIAVEDLSDPAVLLAARRIARAAIDICLDGRELKSRKVMYAIRGSERRHSKHSDEREHEYRDK